MSEAPDLHDTGSLPEAAGRRLAAMYGSRGRALYGLCRMMLRDPHEAEDALQSTFLSAHRALMNGTVPREEAAWLATIARNECRSRINERMRLPLSAQAAELESVADPARTAEELLADDGVGKALAALPESQREAVVLHDVFGLRAREVGVALGMSVPAVEAVLFRGRRQLRTRLRRAGVSALSLPLGVQEALGLQVQGFTAGGSATIAAGAGLLTKAVAAPTVLKFAAGAAALATAGSVVAVGTRQMPETSHRPAARSSDAPGTSELVVEAASAMRVAPASSAEVRSAGRATRSATPSHVAQRPARSDDGSNGRGRSGHSAPTPNAEDGSSADGADGGAEFGDGGSVKATSDEGGATPVTDDPPETSEGSGSSGSASGGSRGNVDGVGESMGGSGEDGGAAAVEPTELVTTEGSGESGSGSSGGGETELESSGSSGSVDTGDASGSGGSGSNSGSSGSGSTDDD